MCAKPCAKLMMNTMEAMRAVGDQARVLCIRAEKQSSGNIIVLVQDSGVGVDPEHSSRMFEAFYTTKVEGIDMSLAISPLDHPGTWRATLGCC
jgi:C4-dicarboxylate-specific signal transduction histidine kinase